MAPNIYHQCHMRGGTRVRRTGDIFIFMIIFFVYARMRTTEWNWDINSVSNRSYHVHFSSVPLCAVLCVCLVVNCWLWLSFTWQIFGNPKRKTVEKKIPFFGSGCRATAASTARVKKRVKKMGDEREIRSICAMLPPPTTTTTIPLGSRQPIKPSA